MKITNKESTPNAKETTSTSDEKIKKAPTKKKSQNSINVYSSPSPLNKKTSQKISSPEKSIVQIPAPDVIILPQNQHRVFLIWRAHPELETETHSWVIRSDSKELARVSASSRSAFLDISGSFHVNIYRILQNGSESLFLSKNYKQQISSQNPSDIKNIEAPSLRINSSSHNFKQ